MAQISCSVLPANSQTVIVLDSTRQLLYTPASIATNAADMAPGSFRAMWQRAVISVTAECTTQDMTMKYEILTGLAGTSADWKEQGASGSQTVTAGTTHVYEFKPLAADWRIRMLAGSDNPDAVVVKVNWLTNTKDFGA
jgi:hypothetical protein